ncbi:MAG: RsmG family class I SAM-dependent methyltransferase [Acidimicrobiales bacterium]
MRLDAAALRTHEPLLAQLERARALGFLGPGPVAEHIDHAAGFLDALADVEGTVVDLGSGGGVPGLIIGVARPDLHLVLLDATAKRCRFLDTAVTALALRATVLEGRAEAVGRSAWRGTADAVVARAFGGPAGTAECAAPLLRLAGVLLVSEPPEPTADRWLAQPLATLGLTIGHRTAKFPVVQALHQTWPCPSTFPRRDGLPKKRPLF